MTVAKPAKRNLDDFRKAYDKSLIIPAKIKAALAELGDSWEPEGDFIRRVACSTTEFAQYREPFIADHTVDVRGRNRNPLRVWAGTKAYAAKLRESFVQ